MLHLGQLLQLAHLHLLLNHFPIIGTIVGLGLFLVSFVGDNQDLRRAAYIIFAVMALLTLPTFFSGIGAQGRIVGLPGVSSALIIRHYSAAILGLFFMLLTGAIALIGLWQFHRLSRPAGWNVIALLVLSLITVGQMARVGNLGGEIRHPEIRATSGAPVESTLGSVVHKLEPNPDKFAELMISNKFWWAFLMDLHFIGLVILMGAIGALDLRILGLAKQFSISSMHNFVPWALAGFAVSVTSGLLAFIGMPDFYGYDIAFWLKVFALLLLGLNAAAFYLTNTFNLIKRVGPGEDAPRLAKFIAGSSLVLWLVVITMGRYIQSYNNTVSIR